MGETLLLLKTTFNHSVGSFYTCRVRWYPELLGRGALPGYYTLEHNLPGLIDIELRTFNEIREIGVEESKVC